MASFSPKRLLQLFRAPAGIKEDDRRRYFRADGGKANIAPPTKATWYKIVSVSCANGEHTPHRHGLDLPQRV